MPAPASKKLPSGIEPLSADGCAAEVVDVEEQERPILVEHVVRTREHLGPNGAK